MIMDKIKEMSNVSQFNLERGQETLHPLVTVLDQSKSKRIYSHQFISELYIIFLKDTMCGELSYGRSHYDYQNETLLFVTPSQLLGLPETSGWIQPQGWVLAFHPDLIRGTFLSRFIHEYNFFTYDSNEALHVSARKRQIVIECFKKIVSELENPIDKHSRNLIVDNIKLFLDYCKRFYDRQFITRADVNKDVLVKFERLLNDYFLSGSPDKSGLLSVGYCAARLHLSANYFGDLIKKETGRTAQEYIHDKVIDQAKEKMFDVSKSISEIAYELGFKNPPHFTRLFKQRIGQTPSEYRQHIV